MAVEDIAKIEFGKPSPENQDLWEQNTVLIKNMCVVGTVLVWKSDTIDGIATDIPFKFAIHEAVIEFLPDRDYFLIDNRSFSVPTSISEIFMRIKAMKALQKLGFNLKTQ